MASGKTIVSKWMFVARVELRLSTKKLAYLKYPNSVRLKPTPTTRPIFIGLL